MSHFLSVWKIISHNLKCLENIIYIQTVSLDVGLDWVRFVQFLYHIYCSKQLIIQFVQVLGIFGGLFFSEISIQGVEKGGGLH